MCGEGLVNLCGEGLVSMALTSVRQNVDFPEFLGPQTMTDIGIELWLVKSLVVKSCLSPKNCLAPRSSTGCRDRLYSSSAELFSYNIL